MCLLVEMGGGRGRVRTACSLVGGDEDGGREKCEITFLDISTQEGKGVLKDTF